MVAPLLWPSLNQPFIVMEYSKGETLFRVDFAKAILPIAFASPWLYIACPAAMAQRIFSLAPTRCIAPFGYCVIRVGGQFVLG